MRRALKEAPRQSLFIGAQMPSRGFFDKLGAEPGGSTPDAFRELVSRDVAKWARVVREAKISVE